MTGDDTPDRGDTVAPEPAPGPRTPITAAEGLLAIEPVLVGADDPLDSVIRRAASSPSTRVLGVVDGAGVLVGVVDSARPRGRRGRPAGARRPADRDPRRRRGGRVRPLRRGRRSPGTSCAPGGRADDGDAGRGVPPDVPARPLRASTWSTTPAGRSGTSTGWSSPPPSSPRADADTMEPWIALAVFVVTYGAIASDRVDRTLAALLGGAVVILLGIVNQERAFGAVDWNVIFLLSGMMVIAGILRRTGVFGWLAIRTVRLGRRRAAGDPPPDRRGHGAAQRLPGQRHHGRPARAGDALHRQRRCGSRRSRSSWPRCSPRTSGGRRPSSATRRTS